MKAELFRVVHALCVCAVILPAGAGCEVFNADESEKGGGPGMAVDEKTRVPVVYVALGDSTGVGVGARGGGGYVARIFERIERVRPGSRLVNLCVSGATTGDVLRGQVGRVGDARPTLVTVGIGINDLTRMTAPEQF